MRIAVTFFCGVAVIIVAATGSPARADSRCDERASRLNERGRELWGPPSKCDDLTGRRVYLDLVDRSLVAEMQDSETMGEDRHMRLIELLVFGEGCQLIIYSQGKML